MQVKEVSRKKRVKKQLCAEEVVFDVFKYVFITLMVCLCIYPFYYVIIYTISDPTLAKRGVWLLPKGFTLETYRMLFEQKSIWQAFLVSAARTVIGTIVTVSCTATLAFLVTRKELPARKFIYRFIIITMYVGSGLIPWYVFMKAYHLDNTFLLYIIPSAVGAYNMILFKTFFEQLPEALEESALIEGAGFMTILWKILMPLSKPIIATISVYSAVGQWNSWRDNFFLVSDTKLRTLQLLLQQFYLRARTIAELQSEGRLVGDVSVSVTEEAIQMTTLVITVLPILLVYPFAQKYFTKGLMMGAVKG